MEVEFVNHRAEVEEAVQKALLKGLEACGINAETYAKIHIEENPRRVDTGRLRSSITHAVSNNDLTMYLGTNVEYAGYVHNGTSKMEPNRFLENAIKKHKDEYKDILKQAK